MSLQARSHGSSARNKSNQKVKEYQLEVKAAQRELRQAIEEDQRRDLMGSDEELGDGRESQRARLINQTDRLQDGSGRISRARMIASQAEDIGHSILGELGTQRDTILHARDG